MREVALLDEGAIDTGVWIHGVANTVENVENGLIGIATEIGLSEPTITQWELPNVNDAGARGLALSATVRAIVVGGMS
jgi:hypothetical protein